MPETPNKPAWRKGDVIVNLEPGCGGGVLIAEHDPNDTAIPGQWSYGRADAEDFRLANVADVARVLEIYRGERHRAAEGEARAAECMRLVLVRQGIVSQGRYSVYPPPPAKEAPGA